LQPRSDQINADSLTAGPVVVTVTGVVPGKASQPFDFELAEFPGRAYRPGVTMRRVIAAAWGRETDDYTGKRMELYTDPDVRFGKEQTGGIRISRMSGISKPVTIRAQTTRGKRAPFTVEPLPDAAPSSPVQHLTESDIAACTSIEELRGMWQAASPDVQQLIQQRVAELRAQVATMPTPEPDEDGAA
jgi:hypothetical protein